LSNGIEVDHLGLGHILRDGTVRATDALRRRDSLSEAVGVQALARLVRRCVVDVALFGQVNHAKNDLTILRLPEVDVLRDNWVDQIVVCIALSDEFRCQNRCQLLTNRDQFLNVDLRRCVNNRGESIVHVFRGAELLDLCESSVDLITHGGNDIVDGDHAFFIDERLGPNLRIHFVA